MSTKSWVDPLNEQPWVSSIHNCSRVLFRSRNYVLHDTNVHGLEGTWSDLQLLLQRNRQQILQHQLSSNSINLMFQAWFRQPQRSRIRYHSLVGVSKTVFDSLHTYIRRDINALKTVPVVTRWWSFCRFFGLEFRCLYRWCSRGYIIGYKHRHHCLHWFRYFALNKWISVVRNWRLLDIKVCAIKHGDEGSRYCLSVL